MSMILVAYFVSFLFKKTKWGKEKTDESDFLRDYAIVAMLYIELKTKFGQDKAYLIMKEIVVPAGCLQQKDLLSQTGQEKDPMKKLLAFAGSFIFVCRQSHYFCRLNFFMLCRVV